MLPTSGLTRDRPFVSREDTVGGAGARGGGARRLRHLVHGGVAAGDVVLGDPVDLGGAGKVVAHVVFWLHGQHVLELDQCLRPRPPHITSLACTAAPPCDDACRLNAAGGTSASSPSQMLQKRALLLRLRIMLTRPMDVTVWGGPRLCLAAAPEPLHVPRHGA